MRKKKKTLRVTYPSAGPLPARIATLFADCILVFSDASLKRMGGLSAVFFQTPDSSPQVCTRSVMATGSNELELQALVFAVQKSECLFAGSKRAFFSDNQDAVIRLKELQKSCNITEFQPLFGQSAPNLDPQEINFHWIKGHGTCRGNLIADEHARLAAESLTSETA